MWTSRTASQNIQTFCNSYVMCTLHIVMLYVLWLCTLCDVYVLKNLRFGTLTLCAATFCNITSCDNYCMLCSNIAHDGILYTCVNRSAPDRDKCGPSGQVMDRPSRTKSHPAGSLSSSQPGGPPCWASPLANGLIRLVRFIEVQFFVFF